MNRKRTMTTPRILLVALIAVLALHVRPAMAQQQQQQQGQQQNLLPDIDPQDIEIRSEFKAKFPGLRRQPILGFQPVTRTYQVDPNRMPFIEAEDDRMANLPIVQLSRPSPPSQHLFSYPRARNIFARAGIGNYLTPEARGYANIGLSEKSNLAADLQYESSDGHLDNQNSAYRKFNGSLHFDTRVGEKNRLAFRAGGLSNFNYLFPSSLVATGSTPKKTYDGFHVGGEFQSTDNAVTGWAAAANFRQFNSDLAAGGLSGTNTENVFNASANVQWAGSRPEEVLGVTAEGRIGQYDIDAGNTDQWHTAKLGVRYQRLWNFNMRFSAEADAYQIADANYDSKIYLAPNATLEYWLRDNLKLTVQLNTDVVGHSQQSMYTDNRFLGAYNPVQHTYKLKGLAEIKYDLFTGTTLKGGVSYLSAKDYLYYTRQNGGSGFYSANYMNAQIRKIYASVTHDFIPEKFWVHGRIYYQDHELDSGADIPYLENLGLNAGLSFKPIESVLIEGWTDYAGPRHAPSIGEDLKGFLLVGARGSYQYNDRIGAFVKAMNLLDQNYQLWQGYRERPLQVMAGITVKL